MTNPLADRIRPESLEQVVGQQHLLGPGKALRQLIESGDIPNLIFYGPPGVGKTTVASIIAKRTDRALRRLNGTMPLRRIFGHWWQSWTPCPRPTAYCCIWTRSSILTNASSSPCWNT